MTRPRPIVESIGDGATEEEIAERLTIDEGRAVSVIEVRLLIIGALAKLRRELRQRGMHYETLRVR